MSDKVKKNKKKKGSFLSAFYILLAFLSSLVAFLAYFLPEGIPFKSIVKDFLVNSLSFLGPSSVYAPLDVAIFFLIQFSLASAFRKRRPFSFLSLIALYVPYLSMLLASRFERGIETPVFIMERISSGEIVLLYVLSGLSLVFSLLILPVVRPLDNAWKEKRKRKMELEEAEVEDVISTDGPVAVEEVSEIADEKENPLVKEMDKKALKEEKKRQKREEKRKRKEERKRSEDVVESFNTNEDESEPVIAPRYSPDAPLDFPTLTDIPHFSTIEPHEDLKKVTDDPETKFKRSMGLDEFEDEDSEKVDLGPDWDETPKVEKKRRKMDLDSAPKHFKSGGILEATIESLKEIGDDYPNQDPTPLPVSVKKEKKGDGDDFAPSNLSKDHPRYKLFESLRKKKESVGKAPQKIEESPLEEIEEVNIPQVAVEENPYKKALEEVEKKKDETREKVDEKPAEAEEKVIPRAEDIPSLDEKHKGKYKGADEESADEQDDSFYHTVGVSGLRSNHDGMRGIKARSRLKYSPPSKDYLKEYPQDAYEIDANTRSRGDLIIKTLGEFNVEVDLVDIIKGPTVTMYEYQLREGVAVQKVKSRVDDIAYALGERHIRLLAPVPGKRAIGVEVPNFKRSTVGFKEMLDAFEKDKDSSGYSVPMILGKTITGKPVSIDVAAAPHLLIAGSTGSGKSVGINSLIATILYERSPNDVRLIMVDPKVVELKIYNGIPHLLTPVITDQKDVKKILKWLVDEMTRRYEMVSGMNVRSLKGYNEKIREEHLLREKLPYIVLIMDEYADLMATIGKDIESYVGRLTAMARAVGIHIVLATQRPSTDVITGTIKNNITTRIAFAVSSYIDSRTILDEVGAENLLGRGDMFLKVPTKQGMERIQGAFISDGEVEKMVEDLKEKYGEPDYLDPEIFEAYTDTDDDVSSSSDSDVEEYDSEEEEYEEAKRILFEKKSISASFLQRRMRIGYNKAARFIEDMEKEGLISEANGSKPRVLIKMP